MTMRPYPKSGDLFESERLRTEQLAPGAILLRGFATHEAPALVDAIEVISNSTPFRTMTTPGGRKMSVEMTNCGDVGWLSDNRGYRYVPEDPVTNKAWPAMPIPFEDLAKRAAAISGFENFLPDSCLTNRYLPGSKLSLHQDRDERNFDAPIVSVSLGSPAVFLFGGQCRADRPRRILLENGDVVVWGGPARLTFHGIAPLADEHHPLTGACRLNLTFRKAL